MFSHRINRKILKIILSGEKMKIITVVSDNDDNFAEKLSISLENYGGAVLFSKKGITDLSAGNPEFCVVSLENPQKIETENSIIVFLDKLNVKCNISGFSKANAAVYVNNRNKYGFNDEVSIGHSEMSDIIITSSDNECVTLAVNRPIISFSGNSFLPSEIKVFFHKSSFSETLSAVLASVLIYNSIIDDSSLEITL